MAPGRYTSTMSDVDSPAHGGQPAMNRPVEPATIVRARPNLLLPLLIICGYLALALFANNKLVWLVGGVAVAIHLGSVASWWFHRPVTGLSGDGIITDDRTYRWDDVQSIQVKLGRGVTQVELTLRSADRPVTLPAPALQTGDFGGARRAFDEGLDELRRWLKTYAPTVQLQVLDLGWRSNFRFQAAPLPVTLLGIALVLIWGLSHHP
jgi:hypothetical protein